MYKIKPPKYSIVERTRFYKDDKEINLGVVWKWGFTLFTEKPKFLDGYDPEIGVNLGDQYEFDGGDYSDGDEVCYHSSNVTKDDIDEVKEIFKNISGDEYCGEDEPTWKWDDPSIVMFGKLEVKEVEN